MGYTDVIKNEEKNNAQMLWVQFILPMYMVFYSSCSYSPSKKPLMLENTSKERCLNYPLQILKCVLPIVFETVKSFNQNFCEGRSSILIEKAFSEAETKKVNGNILPNDTVLPSFPLSQY